MYTADYSTSAKWLHRLALGTPAIARASLDIDRLARPSNQPVRRPVYITGLARSGTTILLQTLYQTGLFHSLTYRDMPFILMPRLWRQFAGPAPDFQPVKERAHGDRIGVNEQSPEAFEEVFWKNVDAPSYLGDQVIKRHAPGPSVISQYRGFVQQVMAEAKPGQRYLAKNNNNIVRLDALREAFDDARILLVFRDPATQATSLHQQHQRFCQIGGEDGFVRQYMDWLGHYEFGPGHRPFQLNGKAITTNPEHHQESHWLNLWIQTYQELLEHLPDNIYPVCYERLCQEENELQRIMGYCEVPASRWVPSNFRPPPPTHSRYFNPRLLKRAYDIYKALHALHP